jgi:hypothetical protein
MKQKLSSPSNVNCQLPPIYKNKLITSPKYPNLINFKINNIQKNKSIT